MQDMASIVLIAALGVFAGGVVVGIIFMGTRGIRREQRHYREARRARTEQGAWDDLGAREYFLPEEAPDGASFAARKLQGVYIRRPADHSHDAKLAVPA
jgi:hypothetical protein